MRTVIFRAGVLGLGMGALVAACSGSSDGGPGGAMGEGGEAAGPQAGTGHAGSASGQSSTAGTAGRVTNEGGTAGTSSELGGTAGQTNETSGGGGAGEGGEGSAGAPLCAARCTLLSDRCESNDDCPISQFCDAPHCVDAAGLHGPCSAGERCGMGGGEQLYCDAELGTCELPLEVDEPCEAGGAPCAAGTWCEASYSELALRCREPVARGKNCELESHCEAGYHCVNNGFDHKCVAYHGVGDDCAGPHGCQPGLFCDQGNKCRPYPGSTRPCLTADHCSYPCDACDAGMQCVDGACQRDAREGEDCADRTCGAGLRCVTDEPAACSRPSDYECTGTFSFADAKLEAAAHDSANWRSDTPFSEHQISLLERISGASSGISSVRGLECFSLLEYIDLEHNELVDVAPLANLERLRVVYLGWNQITDLTPFASLKNLITLDLRGNAISDISPLSTFPPLDLMVRLDDNPIDCAGIGPKLEILASRGISVSVSCP